MWKSVSRLVQPLITPERILQQQLRTTFILKRRHAPIPHPKGGTPKKLRSRHYIYDLVEDTNVKKFPNIDVILTKYVDGLGNPGAKISVKPLPGYYDLLLPGLAVYATPENLEKYSKKGVSDEVHYSSPNVVNIMKHFAKSIVHVVMSQDQPWTIEPWHIRASFRKCSLIIPEEGIEMPSKPISGPNLELDGKAFLVGVTINKTEKVYVPCTIRHWSANVAERLPYEERFWEKPLQFIFPEDEARYNPNLQL